MKFKIGDKVRKINGYKFEGIIISGGYKLDKKRVLYSVEVEEYTYLRCKNCDCDTEIEQNCGKMVHIFAESDIELIN